MDWGMRNRLSRIIQPRDGRSLVIPIDHGYFLGPTTGLENPRKTLEPLIPYLDAIMLTRGILRNCVDPNFDKGVILRVSGGQSIVGPSLSDEDIITSVEEAIRLNASAVSLSIYVGTEHEHQTLTNLAKLIDECERYGIPVLAVTAVGKELEKREARYLALCCRIAAELGARFVKTYYCEGFDKVVEGCPVPVLIAGGPKMETEMDVFETIYGSLEAGGAGVVMGRNIWQNEHPVAMIRAVRAIIHEDATPKEAHQLYRELVEEESKGA